MPWETPVPGAGYRNVKFTAKEDYQLTKFLAIQDCTGIRRFSQALYGHLGPKASDEFAWSRHRAAKSWMDRYKNNRVKFEHRIKEYKAQRYEHLSAKKRAELPQRPPTAPPVIKTGRKSRTFEASTPVTSQNKSAATSTEPTASPTQEEESTVPVVRALANLKSLLAEEHAETTTRPPYRPQTHHCGELAHPSLGNSAHPGKRHGTKKLPPFVATSTPRKVVDATADVSLIQEFSPSIVSPVSMSTVAAKEGKQRQQATPSVPTKASGSDPARGPAATTAQKPRGMQELLDRASRIASVPAPATTKPAEPPQAAANDDDDGAGAEPEFTAEAETAAQQAQIHKALARLARKTKMF
ncbi:hypothetical protein DFH06DRAFT_1290704, partial [Mycena polygramma]